MINKKLIITLVSALVIVIVLITAFNVIKSDKNESNIGNKPGTDIGLPNKLNIKSSEDCAKNNGVWYNSVCEINSLSKEECSIKGGEFNECNSACRHDPKAEVCTMQCVLTCSFK